MILCVAEVTAVRAKDITAKDWHLLGKASSDTYVTFCLTRLQNRFFQVSGAGRWWAAGVQAIP